MLLGWGLFGLVKQQLYSGIYVAVKELVPRSVKEDIPDILATLSVCHPCLPYLSGVCTTSEPFRYGFIDVSTTALPLSHTLSHELLKHNISMKLHDWLSVCAQVLDAVTHLHTTAHILHNHTVR